MDTAWMILWTFHKTGLVLVIGLPLKPIKILPKRKGNDVNTGTLNFFVLCDLLPIKQDLSSFILLCHRTSEPLLQLFFFSKAFMQKQKPPYLAPSEIPPLVRCNWFLQKKNLRFFNGKLMLCNVSGAAKKMLGNVCGGTFVIDGSIKERTVEVLEFR